MKRRLIYCPEVNDCSVVLLFEKGEEGESWSIRDYSLIGAVRVRYAREFDFTLSQLLERTLQSSEAPAVSTSNIEFWCRLTLETNANLNIAGVTTAEQHKTEDVSPKAIENPAAEFALIDRERLMLLPKARKPEDMRRILHSPNSEDWVTWNAFTLMQKLAPDSWWRHFVGLAQIENNDLKLPKGWEEIPTVSLWRSVPAPQDYAVAASGTGHLC
jgi:hypothetical protein